MITRTIPRTGEAIPVIGLGSWQTFDVGTGEAVRAPLREVLRTFASLGGTLVDSSPMYGKSECVIGDLVAELALRDRLFMATKVWTTGRAAGAAEMETSARLLRADPMDLMQVHNLLDVDTQLDTLRKWKEAGRVRYVGITHYTAGSHAEVARVLRRRDDVDFLQINYSALEPEAEVELLPLARELGVAVIANRPLGGTGTLGRLASVALPGVAAELGCTTWSQLLLKWCVGHPDVTCAIPATSKVGHLIDNMAAGEGELPSSEQRREIVLDLRKG
ncbi:MAG: Aldo/keto reductase [Gemmatimonadetes bacterium]|nr:Aldo/keto reductase [Gemmatimonadota bacterium]